ncbi:MAG: hypothetical protein ACI4W2_05140 [Eubacterium sp.]
MEERLEIEYGQSDLMDYQRQILETGYTGLFLPVSFLSVMEEDGSVRLSGMFQTEGYVSLRDFRAKDVCEALDVVLSLLEKMVKAEDVFLFIGDYLIHPDLVFVKRPEGGGEIEAALAWTGTEREHSSYICSMNQFHDGICSIIDVLEENLQGDGAGYLRHAWNIAAGEGLHAGALRRRIYRVRSEAFECGYSREDSRIERRRPVYRDPLDVAEKPAGYAE